MRKLCALILAVLLSLSFMTNASAEDSGTWMYVISVGKADAILLGADGKTCLIDTGYAYSRGKILAAMDEMNVTSLDAVFITHTDSDHVGGLDWLSGSDIEIGTWYASAMYTGVKESKHPAVKAAENRDEEVVWLEAGDQVSLGSAVLNVLAPSVLSEDKDNDNSLVMMLTSGDGSILLCGDMEFPEEEILLASGYDLSCDVIKIANHADDDTASESFLRAAAPEIAVISTDSAEKEDTPDTRILAILETIGAETYVTQECTGGILVTLSGGTASAQRIDLEAVSEDVVITSVVAGEDTVTLANQGSLDADLGGWYLYSDRGGEMYIIPDGTILASGETITIGSNSTEDDVDLTWDDKKVIHRKKTDVITLYSESGVAVSGMDNGL